LHNQLHHKPLYLIRYIPDPIPEESSNPKNQDQRASERRVNEEGQDIEVVPIPQRSLRCVKDDEDMTSIKPYVTKDHKKGIKCHNALYNTTVASLQYYRKFDFGMGRVVAHPDDNYQGLWVQLPLKSLLNIGYTIS
jgi:hypothetical protein